MKKTLLIAAAFLAAPIAANAQQAPEFTIDISRLDLATDAGQKKFDVLVEREIRRTCQSGSRGLGAEAAERDCRADLRNAARGAVEAARAASQAPRYASTGTSAEA